MAEKLGNIKCTVVAATRMTVREEDRSTREVATRGNGYLVLKIDPSSQDDMQTWLSSWSARPAWRETPVAVDLRQWYKAKTLDQLKLLFSLCGIMALEQDGKRSKDLVEGYYHGLLQWYAPRVEAKLPDGRRTETYKTASEMTTVELSRVIEGGFRELSLMGVHLGESQEIRNYYIEWRTWRGRLRRDGLEETYESLQDYKDRVPFCEATLQSLGAGKGHLAHIVSKGAGGASDETWNYLHLSGAVHIHLQHTKGWVELLERYPHLIGKVNIARKKHGLPAIKEAADLYNDIDVDENDRAAAAKPVEGTDRTVDPEESEPTTMPLFDAGSGASKEDRSHTDPPENAPAAQETGQISPAAPQNTPQAAWRLYYHPESESYVATTGEGMNEEFVSLMIEASTEAGFASGLRDLVDSGKMKDIDAREILAKHDINPSTYEIGLF